MEFETLVQKINAVATETELATLLAESNMTYDELFFDTARSGHTEAMLKIWEFAKDKISSDAISNLFRFNAREGNIETMLQILKLAKDKISIEALSYAKDIIMQFETLIQNIKIVSTEPELATLLAEANITHDAVFRHAAYVSHRIMLKFLELAKDKISDNAISNLFRFNAREGNIETMLQILKLAKDKISIEALSYAKDIISIEAISKQFKSAAESGKIETILIIWDLAKDKISSEDISFGFKWAAESGKIETILIIWDLAKDKISSEAISDGFKWAANSGYTETISKILELAKDKISSEDISDGFKWAVIRGYTETISKILELAKDKISSEDISDGFKWAAEWGLTETISKILEFAKDKISSEAISDGFKWAANRGYTETISKIWEVAKDKISSDVLIELVINEEKYLGNSNLLEIIKDIKNQLTPADLLCVQLKKALQNNDKIKFDILLSKVSHQEKEEVSIKLSEEIVKTNNKEHIKTLVNCDLFVKSDSIKLIGFANYVGEWSRSVIDYIKKDNHIGVISLDLEDTKDQKFLGIFDGFINPGAHDTFPGPAAFDLTYLDSGEHSNHEYAYQNVINFSKANSVPYLGLCNGAQHLILNSGGLVAKAATPHNHVPHTLKVELGTIVQFLAMNEQEQELAITNGYFPEMEFLINTQHNYAGVKGKIGSLELGGLSDEGVVEAVAHKFYQVGFQFHPENMYYNMEDKAFGRNGNLLKNTFKFFTLSSKKIDLEKVHEYMFIELKEAFAQAKCTPDEKNTCPAHEGLARDIFSEAVAIATIEA